MLTHFINFHTLGADAVVSITPTLSASPGRTITIVGEDRIGSILGEDRIDTIRPENRKVPLI